MCNSSFRAIPLAAFALLLVAPAHGQSSDGAGRGVARLSLLSGDVSVRRGDSGDVVAAAVNGPLVVQDRVYTGANSRAEIQFDFANFLRMASNAEIRLAELEHRRYQIQLAAGLTTFTVLRDSEADVEISTPSVSLRPLKRGSYRVMISSDSDTEVTVRRGELEVFTPTGTQRLKSGQMMRVRGTASSPQFQILAALDSDDWDRWNRNRDRDLDRAVGYRYVSRDIYGVEDLDSWGSWVSDPGYGWVWSPRVAAGWAPYRYGRWTWLDWYGWSWVSYDPWGWAPFHYGRWYYGGRGWCWYPGGVHVRHYWSPALVAFVGFGHGAGVGFGFGTFGWVPLGPRDPFHRWWGPGIYRGYRDGRYFDNHVNVANNINIRNVYGNSRVDNAITAMDARDFTRGRSGASLRMSDSEWNRASVVQGAVPLTPERDSLRMADRVVTAPVRSSGEERGFYSRRQATPVERVPFEQQRAGMERLSRQVAESGTRGVTSGFGRTAAAEGARTTDVAPVERSTGWRSVGDSGSTAGSVGGRARVVGEDPATGSGWRTFGDPANRGTAERNAGSSGFGRSQSTSDSREQSSGWRSFGDPVRRGEASGNQQDSSDSQSVDRSSRITDRALERSSGAAGTEWRRFEGGATDRTRDNSGTTRWGGSDRSERRTDRDTSRQSIEVSPPIVRERSESRGGFGGGSRSSERMSSPSGSSGSSRGSERMSSPGGSGGGSRGSSGASRGDSGGSRGGGGRGRDR